MTVIDADAHVIESERTWSYMDGADRRHQPSLVRDVEVNGRAGQLLDYRRQPHLRRSADKDETEQALREMEDIPGRLAHMDQLGTTAQVLYPTIFLRPVTADPATELALCKSYNRWLADIWKQAPDRMRWAVIPPLTSMSDALQELELGKQNGACAVFMRGVEPDRLDQRCVVFSAL